MSKCEAFETRGRNGISAHPSLGTLWKKVFYLTNEIKIWSSDGTILREEEYSEISCTSTTFSQNIPNVFPDDRPVTNTLRRGAAPMKYACHHLQELIVVYLLKKLSFSYFIRLITLIWFGKA